MMASTKLTPLVAVLGGAVAGAVGTLAMDLVWYRRHRRAGGEAGFYQWEFSSDVESYEEAAAPAKVGKRLVEGLFKVELPPETAGLVNNTFHWLTGMMWGTVHGIVAGSIPAPVLLLGPATGATAWAAAYSVLAPADLYKPIWEYDTETLWKDLSAHIVYGTVTAVAFRVLTRPPTTRS